MGRLWALLAGILLFVSTLSAETGIASWHAPRPGSFAARTASGKPWVNSEMIAAHKKLKLNSYATVENLRTGKTVTVKITDRGPYIKGRIIDVSPTVADALGFKQNGIAKVRVTPVTK